MALIVLVLIGFCGALIIGDCYRGLIGVQIRNERRGYESWDWALEQHKHIH